MFVVIAADKITIFWFSYFSLISFYFQGNVEINKLSNK